MAEGLARSMGLEAESAGTKHSGKVDPVAVEVMKEKGIDISKQVSKQVPADFSGFDYVITMGCCSADSLCPVTYTKNKLDWQIDDPKGKDLEFYRSVRDKIEAKIKEFIPTL